MHPGPIGQDEALDHTTHEFHRDNLVTSDQFDKLSQDEKDKLTEEAQERYLTYVFIQHSSPANNQAEHVPDG